MTKTFILASIGFFLSVQSAVAESIREISWTSTSPNPQPFAVAANSSGIWVTENGAKALCQFALSGSLIQEIPLVAAELFDGIATGDDGNLWLTGSKFGKIYRVTPDGSVTSYSLPMGGAPEQIVSGPDKNLWFTEIGAHSIGVITLAGVLKEYPSGSGHPIDIVAGSDGALWFTSDNGSINSMAVDGSLLKTVFLPSGGQPTALAFGADGNLWFTESDKNQIGTMSSAGAVNEFLIPTSSSGAGLYLHSLTLGGDGNLWFIERSANKIGRITTTGAIKEFDIPTANSGATAIAADPSGNLWFSEYSSNQLGTFSSSMPVVLQDFGVD